MATKHPIETETLIDPICGMTVKPETAAGSYQHKGTTYYFCSKGCQEKFIYQTSGKSPSNLIQLGRKNEVVQHGAFAQRRFARHLKSKKTK